MFRLVKILNGRGNQAEPCFLASTASVTYTLGEALTLSAGALVKCGATAKPTHIAAEDYTSPATDNRPLYVYPVSPAMVFECPVTASPASLKAGDRVTLAADATGVTATTASGVATIVDTCGAKATGDKLLVTFQ